MSQPDDRREGASRQVVRVDCADGHHSELAVAQVAVVFESTTPTHLRFPCRECGREVEVPVTPVHLRFLASLGSPWLSSDGRTAASVADPGEPSRS